MDKFLHSFTLDSSKDENVEALFDAQEVPQAARQHMMKNVVRSIKKNEDESYTQEMKTPISHISQKFRLGETIEQAGPNGIMFRKTMKLEGDTLVDTVEMLGKANSKICNQRLNIQGDYLVMTMEDPKSGVTAKRYFRKQ